MAMTDTMQWEHTLRSRHPLYRAGASTLFFRLARYGSGSASCTFSTEQGATIVKI